MIEETNTIPSQDAADSERSGDRRLSTCSACGQEWYDGVERECIRRGKCGFLPPKVDYKAEAIRWKYFAESRAKTLEAWSVGEVVSVSELRAKIEALPPRHYGEDMRKDILNCLPNV